METEQEYTAITLIDLVNVIKINFVFISAVMILGFVLTAAYSLVVTPIYASSALIAPNINDKESSRASAMSSLPGISGLMPLSTGVSRSEIAYQKLMSAEFFRVLYENDNFLKDFYSVKSYSVTTKEVTYEGNIDIESLRSKYHFQKGYEDFHKKFLLATYNRKAILINLMLKNKSPELASFWLKQIIFEINKYVKEEEKLEAENSLKYLQNRLSETNIIEVQRVIAALIQEKIQTLMLAEVSEEYLFDIIDEPYVPNYRFWPKRTQLTVIGTISSGFVSVIFSMFVFLRNRDTVIEFLKSSVFTRKTRQQ